MFVLAQHRHWFKGQPVFKKSHPKTSIWAFTGEGLWKSLDSPPRESNPGPPAQQVSVLTTRPPAALDMNEKHYGHWTLIAAILWYIYWLRILWNLSYY